eukprot:g4413.t1
MEVLGAHLAATPEELSRLQSVAAGLVLPDMILRNANVLSLHSKEILLSDLLLAGRHIAAITPCGHVSEGLEEMDIGGRYLAPNFIDTHLHIEYSLLTPGEFARCVVPRGTSCVLADPNCIGNVLGAEAMDWAGQTETPLKIFQQISSRIPRSPTLELGGATVTEDEQLERLARSYAVSVGESTPFGFDERAARMYAQALASGRRNTGHTARVADELLWSYAASGISDDHNAFNTGEVLDRIRLGMMITVMSGSMNDNVPMVFADTQAVAGAYQHFSFCADDRHVDDLHRIGHIDHHVREAIKQGVPTLEAYRMASLNAAAYYRLDHLIGSITPLRIADFMVLSDLEQVEPDWVFMDGKMVAEQGCSQFENTDDIPESLYGTVRLPEHFSADAFRVAVEESMQSNGETIATVRAMEMYDGYFKRAFEAELQILEGNVLADPNQDVAKISVVDRHHQTDTRACGFVRGFQLKRGALASTTNCENQNMVVIGTNDEDMAAAANHLRKIGGGYVAVAEGKTLAALPLPVAGIMSDRPWEEVLEASDQVNAAAHSLGCQMPSPFMIMAFVGLAGVPDYGLTEKGLIDAPTQEFIPVVVCCRLVPQASGGGGISHLCSLEIQMRLATMDSSVAQLYKVHDELVREILVYTPEFQRERLAKLIVEQNQIIGLAVAEPGKTAIDPMKTICEKQPDGSFLVNGFKIYTTGAAEADQIATWTFNPAAATEENPLLGMQLFMIPRGTEGVEVNRDWNALGQRATDSGSIAFTNVACPEEWVGSVPGKAPLIHASLRYQAGFSAILCGIGFGALNAAMPYINERSRPWAQSGVTKATQDPMILRAIGELASDLTAAWAATRLCGPLLDAFECGEISRAQLAMPISAAKSASSRAAMAATGRIHELMGTGSIAGAADYDRWWRNARTLSLHDPVEWKSHELGRHLVTGWEPEPGIYQ